MLPDIVHAIQSIALAIQGQQNVSVDANGWRKINHGTYVEWLKEAHYGAAWTAAAGQTSIYNTLLPVGESDFRNLNVQVSWSTPNAAVMLGGYIGGATPDFGTISIFSYNPTGGGISCAYWHVFIRLVKTL